MIQSEQLERLERRLNSIDVKIPLGSFCSIYFLLTYVNRFKPYTAKAATRDLISSQLIKFKGRNKQKRSDQIKRGMPLLTFMSQRPHLYKINDVYAQSIKGEAHAFVLDHKIDLDDLHINGQVITKPFAQKHFFNRRNKYSTILKEARQIFRQFLKDNKLSPLRMISFNYHLTLQLEYYAFFTRWMNMYKPSYLLVESDKYNQIAPMVAAAKNLRIETFTHIHGALQSKMAYYPPIAQNILCWGQMHHQRLSEWGVDDSRLKITGATQLQPIDRNQVKPVQTENLPWTGKKIVLLATNPINDTERHILIRDFCEALQILPDEWVGLLRPHPSEKSSFYQPYLAENPRLHLATNAVYSMEQSLTEPEVVIVYNSAFILDAVINGRPSCVYQVVKDGKNELDQYVNESYLPGAQTPQGLAQRIKKLSQKMNTPSKWQMNQIGFVNDYCKDFGFNAAQNMNEVISNTIKTS